MQALLFMRSRAVGYIFFRIKKSEVARSLRRTVFWKWNSRFGLLSFSLSTVLWWPWRHDRSIVSCQETQVPTSSQDTVWLATWKSSDDVALFPRALIGQQVAPSPTSGRPLWKRSSLSSHIPPLAWNVFLPSSSSSPAFLLPFFRLDARKPKAANFFWCLSMAFGGTSFKSTTPRGFTGSPSTGLQLPMAPTFRLSSPWPSRTTLRWWLVRAVPWFFFALRKKSSYPHHFSKMWNIYVTVGGSQLTRMPECIHAL